MSLCMCLIWLMYANLFHFFHLFHCSTVKTSSLQSTTSSCWTPCATTSAVACIMWSCHCIPSRWSPVATQHWWVLQKCPFYGWNDYHVYLIVEKYRDSKQSYRLKAALCITGLTTVFLLRWPVPHLKATQWWTRCLCLVWTQTFPNLNTWRKNPQKVGFSLFTLACLCSTPCRKASPIFFTVQFAARGKKPLGHGASLSISYTRVRPSSVLFPQQRGFSNYYITTVIFNRRLWANGKTWRERPQWPMVLSSPQNPKLCHQVVLRCPLWNYIWLKYLQ